jgi:hypothetical protein
MKHAALLGLGAALLVAGALLGDVFSAPDAAVADPATLRLLASLDETLRGLRADLAATGSERAAAPPSVAVPITREPDGARSDVTGARLDRLATAVEAIAGGRVSAAEPAALQWIPDRTIDPHVFNSLLLAEEVERDLGHHGWTHQQVLDRYGVPQNIGAANEGAQGWYYETTNGESFHFVFLSGRVVKVIT